MSNYRHHRLGQRAEAASQRHLEQHGLRLVKKNFSCRCGEIDLIMQDNNTLVFIEVRYRTHRQFGGSLGSITRQKQQKIIKTAQYYLHKHALNHRMACRFDVVCWQEHGQPQWIRQAFIVE